MKRIIAGMAWSLFLISNLEASETAGAKDSAKVGQDVGRYQLFQGQYTTYDLKKQQTYTHLGVFHLDTATGQVKRYVNKIDEDGKYTESWVPTDFSPADKKK
ncbi:MAG: hypothetical protein HYV06_03885 [Deltaproteobacteria bacterium]|nr:hypothetical protein [Deltaproteobacteria bacterium]